MLKNTYGPCYCSRGKFDERQNVKTLTADYGYSSSNKENLPLPIQMQVSKKAKASVANLLHF